MAVAPTVGTPVFAEETNWAGSMSDSELAGGVCVTVTATPALTFDPGEPESELADLGDHEVFGAFFGAHRRGVERFVQTRMGFNHAAIKASRTPPADTLRR